MKYETVTFKSKDGTGLHGWFVPATGNAAGTVIHFNGNAQNMSAHFSFVAWLPTQGFNVFAFDYRGYGRSGGKLTRKGVHADAITALKQLKTRKDTHQDRLFVLGQSLGGAVAIRAVADAKVTGIRGIVVESTFNSYKSIARDKGPDMLVNLFISDALSPGPVIGKLTPVPVLCIHGTADGVVPYALGEALFDMAAKPRTLWTIEGGRHTEAFTTYDKTYRPKLVAFFGASGFRVGHNGALGSQKLRLKHLCT